jgi:uncharacterized phage-associated protein
MEVDKNIDTTTKIQAFEYFVYLLIKWYLGVTLNAPLKPEDVDTFNKVNDFSKLKLLKLLFLACAESEDRKEAYGIFNNFVAMEFGPVELDIYEFLKIGKEQTDTDLFKVDRKKVTVSKNILKFNNDVDLETLCENSYYGITNCLVKNICQKDISLISKKAWDLVELSHQYKSWMTGYDYAMMFKKLSFKMNKTMLLSDESILPKN